MHILFICTGNTCRSSMAEGMMKYLINKDKLNEKITCSSAGIAAFSGDVASEHAISVLKNEWGIDISDHRSRQVSKYDIDKADIILTMTMNHKMALASALSENKDKIYTLKEYAGLAYENIDDPYGQAYEEYKACAQDIMDLLVKVMFVLGGKKLKTE